jgi:hypothetical protein
MTVYVCQVRNPSSSLCLDLLGKDEKQVITVGMFYCQLRGDVGISSNQVSHTASLSKTLCVGKYMVNEYNDKQDRIYVTEPEFLCSEEMSYLYHVVTYVLGFRGIP